MGLLKGKKNFVWRAAARQGETYVELGGSISEHSEFQEIVGKTTGPLALDLAGIARVNSIGMKKWSEFVTALERGERGFTLERCPPIVVAQLNMIAGFLGRLGRVRSVYAPYLCQRCDIEHQELIELELVEDEEWNMVVHCPSCKNEMMFDELPRVYFAFQYEQRRFARIETDVPCLIRVGQRAEEGRLSNLSQGGALVVAAVAHASVGDRIVIEFDSQALGQRVEVAGRIVRVLVREGETLYGVQSEDGASGSDLLRTVLEAMLGGPGIGNRRHPRVYRAIHVQYWSNDEQNRAVMRNLSLGGARLECREEVAKGKPVRLAIPEILGVDPFEILGTVAYVREVALGIFDVGVAFGALSGEQESRIGRLIRDVTFGAPS